ncbi:PAP2 superfamily-domain-containing protein [Chlamydoabsidia padenii]|nr:PAP2 superfamily-domain-containing protein [Chlamydoabsidia padenii]
MARKIFKTFPTDRDAGTHHDRLYDTALHPWRSWLRRSMLPLVRRETHWIATVQKRIRTPFLDHYFLWTANLGTHTFFMVFLPVLIWFGSPQLGRSIACLAAFGVFWSGFIKDFMCLPRPLSPPVHRLTMSQSVALEYGFPSTHSTNSISVALYLIAVASDSLHHGSPTHILCIIGAILYAVSVVAGRIYCGMHGIIDVLGGTLLAILLYWAQWAFRDFLDGIVMTSDSYGVLMTIPICLILVGIHVCFMGVIMGVYPGSWLCNNSDMCRSGLETSLGGISFGLVTLGVMLTKVIIGVSMLFIWRIACKKVCYFLLPPVYRAFDLPHRKFEVGARYTLTK